MKRQNLTCSGTEGPAGIEAERGTWTPKASACEARAAMLGSVHEVHDKLVLPGGMSINNARADELGFSRPLGSSTRKASPIVLTSLPLCLLRIDLTSFLCSSTNERERDSFLCPRAV